MLCTSGRAKKVVVGLTLVALITTAIEEACWHGLKSSIVAFYINPAVFHAVMPMAVLTINAIVVREVRRRASSNAARNLGLQHQQSTSSNSAVPTVMLVTTSLIYVLLSGAWTILELAQYLNFTLAFYRYRAIALGVMRFIYTYNFYVYLITGKQFRTDLLTLICCCYRPSSSSSSSAAAAAANTNVEVFRHGLADSAV